jgi:hypothetical protein
MQHVARRRVRLIATEEPVRSTVICRNLGEAETRLTRHSELMSNPAVGPAKWLAKVTWDALTLDVRRSIAVEGDARKNGINVRRKQVRRFLQGADIQSRIRDTAQRDSLLIDIAAALNLRDPGSAERLLEILQTRLALTGSPQNAALIGSAQVPAAIAGIADGMTAVERDDLLWDSRADRMHPLRSALPQHRAHDFTGLGRCGCSG